MAEEVGQVLARGGATVVTGGLGGVMRAASRGAAAIDGQTIGILPGADPAEANEFIQCRSPPASALSATSSSSRRPMPSWLSADGDGTLSETASRCAWAVAS